MTQNSDPKKTDKKDKALDPDPETLHKTDPQENMKGPVSSIMQNLKDDAEKNNEESKDEADKKKDSGM